ncbi:MAG: T9SS type A sorting domain-containing protein [Bacteroidota bacterium]
MKRLIIILGVILSGMSFAQTGPAGVGNANGTDGLPENIIWLDASTIAVSDGADVSTWTDISGNGVVFAASSSGNLPSFSLNQVNGLPTVVFDDANAERLNINPFNNMASSEISSIIVFATPNTDEALLSYAVTGQSNEYLIFDADDLKTFVGGPRSGGGVFNDGINTFNILSTVWNSTGGQLNHYKNGSVVNNASLSSGDLIVNGGSMTIGGEQDNVDGGYAADQDLEGEIAEIIVYSNAINNAERIIIENYLSEKYNIAISSDFFTLGDAAFNNDLTGIGTDDGINKSSLSGFSDALQIEEETSSLNAANEFIFIAHDNTPHSQTVVTDFSDPEITDRWARSWFFEVSGGISAELTFDFGLAGLGTVGPASDYVLLYRATTSDDYTRIITNSVITRNGDQVVIDMSNQNLPTGYYTLGRGTQLVNTTYYSFQSGNWEDPLTWTTDPSGALRVPGTGNLPTANDNVVILSGTTVRMATDNNDGIQLTVNGRLDLENTSEHNYISIEGNGIISLEGAGGVDNFPTGATAIFADSIVGGTVLIQAGNFDLNVDRNYNNVIVDLASPTNAVTLLSNYTINGDLTIQTGIFQINDNTDTDNLNVSVFGDVQTDANGQISVGTGNARHEFNFYGNFINNGRADFTNRTAANNNNEATDGIVDANFLNESANQSIDCNGITNFYRIEIDKGDDETFILDINSLSPANFNIFGPVDYSTNGAQLSTNDNALGLIRGTVRLNTNVDVPLLNNTGNYSIFESARLWVNGGSTSKVGGEAIVPYGIIQVSDGTLDAPVRSGITTRDNGTIIVEGGVLTVNQIRTSVLGAENIGGYFQSGGTVNVTGQNVQQNYYTFSLTYPGNSFNMSGGTLRVSGSDNFNDNTGGTSGQIHGGGIFIDSDPSNVSVTGGTVIMENNTNIPFKVTSKAPFWNVIMTYTSGTATEIDLDAGTSGDNSLGEFETITNPALQVLNDFTIEDGVIFDHNGFNVEIGSDFVIRSTGDYLYDSGKPNTTTINGVDDASLTFLNRTGDGSDEQRFWNFIVDKPTGRIVTLESGKSDVNGNNNNLLRVEGDALKVLSGTLNQGRYSIRVLTDTLLNYDELTIYNPANATPDATVNGNNDLLKLRPDDFVLVTADTSRFGNVRLNNGAQIVTLVSDLRIDRLEYRHGRIDLGEHNLTIDELSINLNGSQTNWNGCGGCNSVEDMFITNGLASAGGLSLLIPSNGTYDFPFGIGTDGLDVFVDAGNSKYTPASVTVSGLVDDGYITIRPVDNILATTDGTGGDILSYYWRVNFEEFGTLPTVEYEFTYYDDDLDGSANEAAFAAGKVLEVDPFTRSFEDDPTPEGVDAVNNVIAFDGSSDTGFTLEEASYTAGEQGRFLGAPTIYYSTTVNDNNQTDFAGGGYRDQWNRVANWSTVGHYSPVNAGTFPQAGDIAILGFGLDSPTSTMDDSSPQRSHWFEVSVDAEAAKLIFAESVINSNGIEVPRNGSFQPQLVIEADDAHDIIFGTVEGNGTFNTELDCSPCNIDPNSSSTVAATINGDFGLFADNEFARFDFDLLSDNNSSIYVPSSFPVVFPNVNVKGRGGNGRRLVFQEDIIINRNLSIREGAFLKLSNTVNGDITVGNNLNMTINNDGDEVEFPQDGPGRTLTISGNIIMDNDNDRIAVLDNNSAADVTISRLRVGGDIIQDLGQINLYSGAGANRDHVELELFGTESSEYTRSNNPEMSLYRLIVNKGPDKNTSFTFDNSFSLNGETDGATKALELQNGNLVLNDSGINLDLSTGGDDFNIQSGTSLTVTQGTVNVSGDNSGILLDGCLVINGGTVDMNDASGNGNNYIEYSASGNAILDVSSGSLIVGSQIRGITTAETGILKYRQTGGDVRIGTQAAPQNNRGMLQIYNTGSEFTYTGGTLTIERHQNSPSVAALFLDPDDSEITETIQIFNANTPSGQNDFRINSVVPLENLLINGTNSPTAEININALTINGDLTIEAGATLNGNARTLTIGGDLINDGSYDAQGNETVFNSSATQQITGSGSNTFFRFTKTASGTLDLTNSIDVSGLFTISEGIMADNGFSINLAADAIVDGVHSSTGGTGLVFAGGSAQELRRSGAGTGSLGVVTINNPNGVTIPDGNDYNFNINGGLRLSDGVFDVGGSEILLGINAEIEEVNSFGITNMIRTNSSFTDGGVGKVFSAGPRADFIFPIGQSFYTPVTFDFGTVGSTSGIINILPANEVHPTVNDGVPDPVNPLATGDVNNALQYYWTVRTSGLTGFTADMNLEYDQSDVLTAESGLDEDDYIAARILSQNNPTFLINKFTNAEVFEPNTITFNFPGVNSDNISGDYFAGIDEAIPNNVITYTVVADGDANTEIYDIDVPGSGNYPSGSVVVIPNGRTLTLPLGVDGLRLYAMEIQDGGVLEVDNSTNHRLGELTGTGTIRILSDGTNATKPAFSGNFFSCSGGGLEYGGSGSYNVLGGITEVRNLSMDGSGDRILPNNVVTVCEDLVVNGPTVEMPISERVFVQRDAIINSGIINTGIASSSRLIITNDFILNGGIVNGSSNGAVGVSGDIIVDGGIYNMGLSGHFIVFRQNFELISGSINSQTSLLIANSNSFEQRFIGNFTGSNNFHNIRLDNRDGNQDFFADGNIELSGTLEIVDGRWIFDSGSHLNLTSSASINPPIGSETAYIVGRISKPLLAGASFTFPIGSTNRWRPASINNVSAAGLTWSAEYFEANPTSDPLVDNLDATNGGTGPGQIQRVSDGEYWKISDDAGATPPATVTARVGLSWGIESNVSPTLAEREELEVMIWNDGLSSWDNLDGQSFQPLGTGGNHTQSGGRFTAVSTNNFSEQTFTLGSTTTQNALPIDLQQFTGETVEGDNHLEWITASEVNNDYFVLERSSDGVNYETLAQIDGQGTRAAETTYRFIDINPLSGKNYYRLKQIDIDGTETIFSDSKWIVLLTISSNIEFGIKAYPNPTVQSNINLELSADQNLPISIQMVDTYGRVVFKESYNPGDFDRQMKIQANQNLRQGIYIIVAEQDSQRLTRRVIITE